MAASSLRLVLAPLLLCLAAGAQTEDLRALDPAVYPHPERILSAHLQEIAAVQLAERRAEVDRITTREGYEARKARLLSAVKQMAGGLDDPRTPLNARETGSLTRDGYRVHKVIYESRPNFHVTANLYIPTTGRAPYPAVLQPVGHSTTAKNRAFYQKIAIALVKTGFVVLTYDPVGQGERRIFWDEELGDSKAGSTTTEHNMVGWQSLLGGETLAKVRIWDGMRGIDYLMSRPEVDGTRIGVTGCSGGGTLTTYLAALDQRVRAAAPACYISDWEDQLKGTGPQDAEQQFPDQLREGLNHADWIGLAAPKPYLIVSTDQDFFPLEGARKAFQEMKRVYTLYDAAGKIEWFHEPGGHGVPDASRNAICAWMSQWLRGEPARIDPGPIRTEHEEDLNVTPTGQVATSFPRSETASTWNIRRFGTLVPARRPIENPAGVAALRQALRAEVAALTRYRPSAEPLNLRAGRAWVHATGFSVQPVSYQSERGLVVPGLLCGSGPKLALLLDPLGKAHAVRAGGEVAELVRLGYKVFALDVSGTGEVEFRRHDAAPWSFPQVNWLALMVGRPLLGIRLNDVIRGIDALAAAGHLPASGEVMGIARGRLAPLLLHAAVLDDRLTSVVIEQGLSSYRLFGASAIHRDLEDNVIPGVLGRYDLPDLAAALAPRPVTIFNSARPNGRLLLREEAEVEFRYTAAAYAAAGAPARFRLAARGEDESLAGALSLR